MAAITPQYTHLYYEWHRCWDGCWGHEGGDSCWALRACPITRITAKRIYFRGGEDGPKYLREREFFVNRASMESDGDPFGRLIQGGGVYHRAIGHVMHLEPPSERPILNFAPIEQKSLSELRREMADLHPDRGGDPAAFRAAHRRYVAAKRVSR